MKNWFYRLTLIFSLVVPGSLWAETIVIEGGTLITGSGRATIANAVLVIEGERISAVGPAGSVRIPAGAQVIDARGKTIMPGLFNSHIHYWDFGAELYIAHGVTSVIDTGNRLEWILAQRDGINAGRIFGPRIFPAGWLISNGKPGLKNLPRYTRGKNLVDAIETARLLAIENGGGLPNMPEVMETNDVASARELTRLLAQRKVAFIKTHGMLTLEQIKAIAEEADKFGLRVGSHLDGGISAREAVEAGVDLIVHSRGIAEDTVSDPKLQAELRAGKFKLGSGGGVYHHAMDPATFPALIDFLVQRNIFLQTDFTYSAQGIYDRWEEFKAERIKILEDPNLVYISPDEPNRWINPAWLNAETPAEWELRKQGYRKMLRFMKEFAAAGGKILLGTDVKGRSMPGIGIHQEMQLMVEDGGIPPLEVIKMATQNPAEFLGEELGTLEVGKLADVLVVRGNPLQDIRNTRNVDVVIKGGKIQDTAYHAGYSNPIPRHPRGSPAQPQIPFVRSVSPFFATEGGPDLTVTVRGRYFTSNEWVVSYVKMGGVPLKTTAVSSEELKAVIPARLLRSVGNYPITVYTPPNSGGGGGESQVVGYDEPVYFMVKF